MLDQIQAYASESGADLSQKKGVWVLSRLIAERKAFLSRKKLTYAARFRIDDVEKTLDFSETLVEKGSGFSSSGGGDGDFGTSPGFGFRKEVYKAGVGGREGSIEEQSTLFGKEYRYAFDYQEVRKAIEGLAIGAGYRFRYHVTPVG